MTDLSAYASAMRCAGLGGRTVQLRSEFARARWAEWHTWDLSASDLADWLDRWAGWTKRTYFVHLRSLYDWLVSVDEVPVNPMLTLTMPTQPRPRPWPLPAEQARASLAGVSGNLEAFLLLGRLGGLRRSEVAVFRGEHINELHLRIPNGKGGTDETLPTHPDLWELAQRYPRTGWWFPSPRREGCPVRPSHVTKTVSTHFSAMGIAGSSHRNRHTYATELVRKGTPVHIVQDLMRHASLATTQAYLGIDENERQAAIRRLSA